MDHALSDGDSTELCARLKERGIPYLSYSGLRPSAGRERRTAPHIAKPVTMDVLMSAVEGLLVGRPPGFPSGMPVTCNNDKAKFEPPISSTSHPCSRGQSFTSSRCDGDAGRTWLSRCWTCDAVAPAMQIINASRLDVAVLDINLGTELSFPIADALAAIDVPFLFLTAHDRAIVPDAHSSRPLIAKPFVPQALARALALMLAG